MIPASNVAGPSCQEENTREAVSAHGIRCFRCVTATQYFVSTRDWVTDHRCTSEFFNTCCKGRTVTRIEIPRARVFQSARPCSRAKASHTAVLRRNGGWKASEDDLGKGWKKGKDLAEGSNPKPTREDYANVTRVFVDGVRARKRCRRGDEREGNILP